MLLSQIASGLKKETTNSFNQAFFKGRTPEVDILKDTLKELGMNVTDTVETDNQNSTRLERDTPGTTQSAPSSQSDSKPQSRKEKRERERLTKKIESMEARQKQISDAKEKEMKSRLDQVRREVQQNSMDAERIKRVLGSAD